MSIKIAQDYQYQGNGQWNWSVWIDGTQNELDNIKQVTYKLHPTFPNPVRTIKDRDSKFQLKTSGWGVFRIFAEVLHADDAVTRLEHDLELNYPENINIQEITIDIPDISAINIVDELLSKDNDAGEREIYEQSVDISRKVLGDDHPETAAFMSKLANIFYVQGDLLNARELQMKVVESTRRVLGEEHPDVIGYTNNLATTLYAMGNLQEAQELQEKVLEKGVKILEENHADIQAFIKDLATTLRSDEYSTMAQKIQISAVEICKKVLAEKKPEVHGYLLSAKKIVEENPEEIKKVQGKVLELKSIILGEERRDSIKSSAPPKFFTNKES